MAVLRVSKVADEATIYRTIQSAVNQASPGDTIEIANGVYYEKLHIEKSHITLVGESMDGCVITYDDYALKKHSDGKLFGTFRTYTCLVLGDHITLKSLTIENSSGDGRTYGQAIALFAQGDHLSFVKCHFIAYQDTVFLGPLPQEPKILGSFVGPTEKIPYQQSKQFFDQCEITGDVDYIFGSALSVFHSCRMITRNRDCQVNGYVTAPSTWSHEPYGFVFINCEFIGEKGILSGSVFLGRPWRPYGQVKLINCKYDTSIHMNHWDSWGNEGNKKTARFSEHGCEILNDQKESYQSEIVIEEDHNKEESPFIMRTKTIPEMIFLDPWHQEKIKNTINPN